MYDDLDIDNTGNIFVTINSNKFQCGSFPNFKGDKTFTLTNSPNIHFYTYQLDFLTVYKDKYYFVIDDAEDDYGVRAMYIVDQQINLIRSFSVVRESKIKINLDDGSIIITHVFDGIGEHGGIFKDVKINL